MRRYGWEPRLPVTAFVSALALGMGAPALAQSPQYPTTPIAPTRPELTRPVPNAPSTGQTRARVRDDAAFAEAPCPLKGSSLRVSITSVEFQSADGLPLPPRVLAALHDIGPATTGETSIEEVCQIRDAANAALHRAGWVAAVQFPPSNDLSTHVLHLRVVTAHFANGASDIHVHGDAGPYRRLLDKRIEQLVALNPLNQFDAERILLEARDIPGLDLDLSLRSAGTTPGAVVADLRVSMRPYDVLANIQNYGSRQVGPETAFVRAEFYGLYGVPGETYLGLSNTLDVKEQRVLQLGQILPVGSHGGTLDASLIYAWSSPNLGALDLRTDSSVFNIEYAHPLARSIGRQLKMEGGLDIIEQKTRIFGGARPVPLNLDRLRVAYVQLDGGMQKPDPFGGAGFTLRGDVAVRQGLDILEATRLGKIDSHGYSPSLPEGDPKALVLRADADAVLGLGPIFILAGKMQSQWSNHPLLSYEKYSIGNLSIGRGYDPGANSGDRALALRAEVRASVHSRTDNVSGEFFGFYDHIHLQNLDHASTEKSRTLASWGGGFRYFLPQHLVAELMYAKPLNKALSIDRAPPPGRVMFSLTMQFGPR